MIAVSYELFVVVIVALLNIRTIQVRVRFFVVDKKRNEDLLSLAINRSCNIALECFVCFIVVDERAPHKGVCTNVNKVLLSFYRVIFFFILLRR